jgi:4'-phosphopantetheinyl transferase
MCIISLELSAPVPLEKIPHLWEQNDILILLINLNNYNLLNTEYLDLNEKEHLESLKTSYFIKRYIVSRNVLKYILQNIPGYLRKDQSLSEIGTYNDEYGKIHIRNHKELHICISYSRNIISLAISKVEVGVDIELKRAISPGKVLKYLTPDLKTESLENQLDFLIAWTLKEAYCKFSNKSMLFVLNKELELSSIFHSSYVLNDKFILSVISDKNPCSLNISCLSKIEFHKHGEDRKKEL